MPISYSFHLSNKSNSVGTIGKVGQCSRHNLREYKSEKYDRSLIEVLRGSESSILDDVKKIYHDEFDQCLEAYNKGKRADRQIHDYLQHVSDSRSDVAAEIIIQLGDKDFWADKTMEEKKQMSYVFVDQLRSLEKLCPEFKIASAVVHYDEASPHMHIVGVPVAEGYKKGMPKQVAKTKVFTADHLSYLQDRMRENMERGMELNQNLFADQELKEKEKGRNRDIPKEALETYYEMKKQTEDLQRQADQLQTDTEKQKIKLQVAGDAYGYIAERAQDHEIPEIEIKEITVRDSVFQSHKEYHLIIPENTLEEAEERKKELMEQNEMDGFMFKMKNDPRIIPGIGKKIRAWSLDEFPQFINVLKGDMSLIGTRPPTLEEFERYEAHHKARLSFKPGITGLWQVSGRNQITDFEEVVRLDNTYIQTWNIRLDIIYSCITKKRR